MDHPVALQHFDPAWFEIEPALTAAGYLDYSHAGRTYKLWYGIAGGGSRPPLLALHGGPGLDHIYLTPLQALAFERQVIFYDQLGCGQSSRPDDPSLWTIDRAVAEAEFVRAALGLTDFHLYGSSYGAMLAAAFAIAHPRHIRSVTLCSPLLSLPYYMKHAAPAIKASLPAWAAKAIDDFELRGEGNGEEYAKASNVFVGQYYFRSQPLPPPVAHMLDRFNPQVMSTMLGSALNVSGNMKDFDVTAGLAELTMPVFLHCGRFDIVRREELQHYASFAPSARTYVFENSAHFAMIDAPLEYAQTLRQALVEMGGEAE